VRLSRVITTHNRADLIRAVELAPLGAQFELVDDPRTTAQNRLMWALLNDISAQHFHGDPPEKWEPEDWKCAFMKAMGFKLTFMPALDGQGVVALGYRSSKLDKEKFSELIETIYEFGAGNGVRFRGDQDDRPIAAIAPPHRALTQG
jgi:hypothetical protein